METLTSAIVEWGVAALTLPGQARCGDSHVVSPFPGGVLVAAVDGLGHGDEAASAAGVASAVLREHAEDPVTVLFERCHRELRDTRGVVMSVASFEESSGLMTWLGVGNVEGVLLGPGAGSGSTEESLLLRGGVVGAQMPRIRTAALPVASGCTLVLATDGVDAGFSRQLARHRSPQAAAEAILALHGRQTDDALVIVARYRGRRP